MVREGYKETEIGEIPVEWEVGPISDIAFVNPKTNTTLLTDRSEVTFLPMENVSESGKVMVNEVREFHEVKNGYTSFKEGDVLFAKITPCMQNGKGAHLTGLKNGVGFGSTEFHVLRPKSSGNSCFIYHLTLSKKFRLVSESYFSGSAGQQRVAKNVFYQYHVPLPPLPEQRRIAAVLSTIDEAIEKTEALIAKLRQVKAGLMQDLLTKGIDEEGRVRSEVTHAFKDSEIGRVPVEWEVVKIDHVKARQKNAISMGPFGSDITVDNFIESGIPVIRGQNLTHHYVSDEDFVYISPKKADELAACNAYKGDIVITHRGTIGQVSIIPQDSKYDRYVVSQSQMKLTCDANLVNPYFVNFYFNSELGKRRLLFRAGYTGVPAIGQPVTSLKGLFVPKPGLLEQRRINSILYAADDRIAREEAYRDKLLAMKKGLMADLLTGKMRVPEGVSG